MVYLGYCGLFKDAILIKPQRSKDLLKVSPRSVFNCYIVGTPSSGKVSSQIFNLLMQSTFLDAFIRSDHQHVNNSSERSVVNQIEDAHG